MKKILLIGFLLISAVQLVYGENISDSNLTKIYHPDGPLRAEQNYDHGILAVTKLYDSEGLLYKEIIHGWAGKVGINRIYNKNGKLAEEYYFEKGCLLQHKKFDGDGRLVFDSVNQCFGERTDKEFLQNGQLKRETRYKSLRIAGMEEYDDQGKLIKQFIRKDVPYD